MDTTTLSPSIINSSSSCINNNLNNNSNSVSSSCHHHYNNQTATNNNSGSGSGASAIGICATIAFMDIKSASKAHTAEHKFDDRILTTEYYEPTSIHHGPAGDSSLVISSQMTATALCPTGSGGKMTSNDNDMKIEIHGRFTTSTSSSHGLVSKKAIFWISFNESIPPLN